MATTSTDPVFRDRVFDTYNESGATALMHNMPRFGNGYDVASLSSDEVAEDGARYMMGVLFAFFVILIPMFFWMVCLMVWKCCCSEKVGFLSGNPFTSPYDCDRSTFKSWQRHMLRTRFIFVIACLLVILFATFLVTRGLTNLDATKGVLLDTNNDISLIIDEVRDISFLIGDIGNIGVELRDQMNFEMQQQPVCPADSAFGNDVLGGRIQQQVEDLLQLLTDLGMMVPSRMENFQQGLNDAQGHTDDFAFYVETVDQSEWIWAIVSVPFILLPSIFIVGAVAGHLRFMNPTFLCLIHWLILPIFIIWTILAWVLASALSVMTVMNADFCRGSEGTDFTPDASMMQFLEHYGYSEEDFVFRATRYYVYQCTRQGVVDPFIFLREYDVQVETARQLMSQLLTSMNELTYAEFSLVCNRDFQPIFVLLQTTSRTLTALRDATRRTVALLSCDRIVPVYTSTMYDGVCEYNIQGMTWIYACLIIVSFFGMLMITLRSSYQNSIIQKHEKPAPHREIYDPSAHAGGSTRHGGDDDDLAVKPSRSKFSDENGGNENYPQIEYNSDISDNASDNKKKKKKKNKKNKKKAKKKDDSDDDDSDDVDDPYGSDDDDSEEEKEEEAPKKKKKKNKTKLLKN